MLRHALVALSLPLYALAAQPSSVRVTISAPNNAQFQLVGFSTDSSIKSFMGRGSGIVELSFSPGEALTVSPTDSTSRLHVEVAENGQLIATGDGPFVTVRKDAKGVSIEVQGRIPRSFDPRKPDELSTLRALARELKKPPT